MSTSPPQSSRWPLQIAIVLACVAIFAGHIWIAWKCCDWSLINRSGAAVVVVAVLSESWTILRTPRVDNMSFWGSQAGHTAVRVSIVVICLGTLIQGYGDYLSALFPACIKLLAEKYSQPSVHRAQVSRGGGTHLENLGLAAFSGPGQ